MSAPTRTRNRLEKGDWKEGGSGAIWGIILYQRIGVLGGSHSYSHEYPSSAEG